MSNKEKGKILLTQDPETEISVGDLTNGIINMKHIKSPRCRQCANFTTTKCGVIWWR